MAIKKHRFTRKEAENFAKHLPVRDIAGVFNNFDRFMESMKIFVRYRDEENFNKLLDAYKKSIDNCGKAKVSDAAYNILELVCWNIDNKNLFRKGEAMELFNEYSKRIKVTYPIAGYSPEEVYNRMDTLSDILLVRYPNLVSNSEKNWNHTKDAMNFSFESRGYNISGNVYLEGKNLVLEGKIPASAKPFRKKIIGKIEKTLENVFPTIEKPSQKQEESSIK
jgi:hypothetical protein